MKNILFYVLFLICLLCLTFGLYAIIQNQWDVLEGSVSVAIAAFIFFILWRNNFFTKSKS
jgi:hypothetical protein